MVTKLLLAGLLTVSFVAAKPFHPFEGGFYVHGGRQLRPTGIFTTNPLDDSGVTIYPAETGGDAVRLARLFKVGGNLLWFLGSLFHYAE